MLELRHMQLSIVVDFERYWEPMFDQVTLKYFYNRLGVGDKEILNRTVNGTIKRVKIKETENWLTFIVDYSVTKKGKKQEFKDIPIIRCKFDDEALRKFILHIVIKHKKRLGSGNISLRILEILVPRFYENEMKNMEVIRKVMKEYLRAINEKEKLEKDIRKIDEKIDNEVFKLYELTDEEIILVKRAYGTNY